MIPILAAQDGTPAKSKLPFAMEQALDRIAKGQTLPEERPVIAMAKTQGKFVMPETMPPAAPACSVPLLEMRVENPDRFNMPRITPGPNIDPMPRAMPAPPCGEK